MSLSQEFLDELRVRTSLSALIGRDMRLRKDGNEWKACCPFHSEKTPSFYVNDDKAFYHCFGCGAHGDAIRWLQDGKGLEFLEAVRQLADAAGLEMPQRSSGDRQREAREAPLHEITERAEAWFRDRLGATEGAEARRYLEGRKIGEEAIRAFSLGFAPDSRSALRRALGELGEAQLIEAGLLARREEGGEPYDRFRGRLIFPIHNARGRPIAFGGRILGPGEPKYLNSPETALFDKGRTLFNLHRAGPAARLAGRVVVVEGYLDVIALAQIEIAEAVAPLGTALTEDQLDRLWRIAPKPILCFDGDGAGQRASVKAAIRALPRLGAERTLDFCLLPPGQDPDDLARQGGRKAVEAQLGAAIPLAELLWRHEHGAEPLKSPEARAALRERLLAHAAKIEDATLAREYAGEFRRRVDDLFQSARRPARGKPKESPAPAPVPRPAIEGQINRKMTIALLRGLGRFPEVARDRAEQVARLQPRDKAIDEAIDLLVGAAFEQRAIAADEIDALFPEERGMRGFSLGFLKAGAWEPRAIADLEHMLDMTLAAQDGATAEQLAGMARAYQPPKPPEADRFI